jgi:hypothetical protein
VRPGEPWSQYVHDSFLQLLVECGPIVLLALGPLGVALLHLFTLHRREPEGASEPLIARTFTGGVLFAALIAPIASPSLTLMPLDGPWADARLLSMATTAGIVALSLAILRRWHPARVQVQLGCCVAVSAFLIHNLFDFDLYAAGAATAFAALLSALPGLPRPAGARARVFFGALALTLIVLVAGVGLLALKRDLVMHMDSESARGNPAALLDAARGPVPHVEAIGPALIHLVERVRAPEAEAILDALPPVLRHRPGIRLAEARYLAWRAAAGPAFAPEALARLEALREPGDVIDVEMLYRRYLIERVAKVGDPRWTARFALQMAERWNLTDRDAPFLADLRRERDG